MYQISPVIPDSMSAEPRTLNVVDVYDIAANIGKEFETIIDNYGPEAVTGLMPRVINILEHLETLAGKNQKEDAELTELQYAVQRLEADKANKAEERERYEKELEQIEDSWRKETSELVQSVQRLQEEKRRLQSALQEQEGYTSKLLRAEEEENHMISKMKETVDKQREELRTYKREGTQKTSEIEALQSQCERLAKLNSDHRRKSTFRQRQAQGLIQDKVELQAQLHDKEQQMGRMKDHIAHQDSFEGAPLSPTSPIVEARELSDSELEKMVDRLELAGKMVFDVSDPNRPRFTLRELRDVLQEKNELKTKLIELEEELAQYRPLPEESNQPINGGHSVNGGSQSDAEPESLQDELLEGAVVPQPARKGSSENSETIIHSIIAGHSRQHSQTAENGAEDDEAPVEGPINKEPWHKLYPELREGSGIRRLFQRFLEKLNINDD